MWQLYWEYMYHVQVRYADLNCWYQAEYDQLTKVVWHEHNTSTAVKMATGLYILDSFIGIW